MGTHPRLFEWVLHYYSTDNEGGAKVVCTSKPPIYLQHQGQYDNILVSYYSLSLYVLQFRAAFYIPSFNRRRGFISCFVLVFYLVRATSKFIFLLDGRAGCDWDLNFLTSALYL